MAESALVEMWIMQPARQRARVAFVLGGGGIVGAHEVGMLRALVERSVEPDLVVGTSVGAVNGAVFAGDPTPAGVERLTEFWSERSLFDMSSGAMLRRLSTLARSRTHLQPIEEVRQRLVEVLPVRRMEELTVPFQCVAASIEQAAEHWFESGPLVDVVLASCAVPGLLPPVKIGDEHFIDGGIVNSIPVSRALLLGATRIYVLQVGRVETPLAPPRRAWEVGLVAFEVARRHRFSHDLRSLPADVEVHVLPTGGSAAPAYNDIVAQLRIRQVARTVELQIDSAYQATMRYLADGQCRQPGSGDHSPSRSR
jgi:NTE family protein